MTKKAILTLSRRDLQQFMIVDQRIIRAQRKVISLLHVALNAHQAYNSLLKEQQGVLYKLDRLRGRL